MSRSHSKVVARMHRPALNRVVRADNIDFMSDLPEACCDLIYTDPPFDSAGAFGTSSPSAPSKGDRRAGFLADYLDFLEPRLAQMHRLLSDRGSLYVHLDWRSVHHVKVMLDEIFGPENFLNEIIWAYRSGGRPARWFPRKHDTLLLYAKQIGGHTFNRLRDGEYRTRGLNVGEDGRLYKSTRNGRLYFDPAGPAVCDVWDIPFLSTVSKERTGYPSQKPEALLERIIRASADEGDLVADFFCGSGVTLAVAKRLGRCFVGCDINPEAVALTENRLAHVSKPS